jgi:hypothetical protein
MGFMQTHVLHVSYICLCKIDYTINKLIHAPTFNYNEVMHFLKLAGVTEQT